MCADYTPTRSERFRQNFERTPPSAEWRPEAFPGYAAPIITSEPREDGVLATFGLLPHWAKPELVRSTYNARSETADVKPSFRNAWRRGQFCIIPAEEIFEPCYETGKAVRWSITDIDDRPLGITGLWESRLDGGAVRYSFSMLTINADDHPVMNRMHKPGEEKRMVVVLDPDDYEDWLHTKPERAMGWMQPYPAERLIASSAPR